MELKNLIKNKKAKVAVVGLGYVGLPTAVEAAKSGLKTFGIDINEEWVSLINNGKHNIKDVDSKELLELINSNQLKVSSNFESLKQAGVVLICVPTPLDKNKIPDVSYIKSAGKSVVKYLHSQQLIILESSTYPGTTREVLLPILQETGLMVGKDFFVAFSPERIDPGNKVYKFKNVPRVVGGMTKEGTNLAVSFYKIFIGADVIPLSSPETAEMTKILENTFRLVNISMINEFALLSDKLGIDIWEVVDAAKTKPYGFMPFYPSPKVGGHCAPLDPFYLSWKAKEHNFWLRFVELAGEINEQMPHFVVTKIISALNKNKKCLNGSKVLILGVAYKKDIGDSRESAIYDIIPILNKKGAIVDFFDPYIKSIKIGSKTINSIKNYTNKLGEYDLVLILTEHSIFDAKTIAEKSKVIVDTRNLIKSRKYKHVYFL